MPYVPQEWNNDDPETPLSASRLTYIENGVEAATSAAEADVAIADVTGLQSALDGKQASGSYAAANHTHDIADVSGLQTALDGKQESGSYAAASHTHDIADVTGLQAIIDDLTARIEALEV